MAFQAVPDAAEVVLVFGSSAYEFTNTLWVTRPGFIEAEMTSLAVAIDNAWLTLVTKPLSSAYRLKQVAVYDQREDGAPVIRYNNAAGTGSHAGEIADRQSAMVVTLRTSVRGRSGRGRLFLGGWTEGTMQAGEFQAANVTQVTTWIAALAAAITNQGWVWSVCSRRHDNAARPVPLTFPITSFEVRSALPGSQNRRNFRP
jgi:hypothetical protein